MDDLTFCPDPNTMIPDDAVVEGEIRIISYLDSEGLNEMFAYTASPGLPRSKFIGLLDTVKNIVQHELMHEYLDDEEDGEM